MITTDILLNVTMDIFNTKVFLKGFVNCFKMDDEEEKTTAASEAIQHDTIRKQKLLEENNRKFINGKPHFLQISTPLNRTKNNQSKLFQLIQRNNQ